MYSIKDCIRFGLLIGALVGAVVETLITLNGGNVTAMQLLLHGAYGIASATAGVAG